MKCWQRQQTQLLQTKLLLKLLLLLLLQLQLGGEVVELRLLLACHGWHEETLVLSCCHEGSLHWVELGKLLGLKLLHLKLLQLLGSCKLCLQQLVVMWLWNKLLWWRRMRKLVVVMVGWRRRWL